MKLAKLNDSRMHVALANLMSQPVPLRIAFKLKGITTKVREELQKYEEVRQGALKQYGNKNDRGELVIAENGTVSFTPENLEDFAKELTILGDTDIEVATVSLADLGDKVQLTADDALALDGILVE